MNSQHSGYDKKRFRAVPDEFDCSICTEVSVTPKQCENCLQVYCAKCIDDWFKKSEQCPNRCDKKFKIGRFKDKSMERLYNSLQLKCLYCSEFQLIINIETHENTCKNPKCQNFSNCGNRVTDPFTHPQLGKMQLCSPECQLFLNILSYQNNSRSLYSEINNFMNRNYPNFDGAVSINASVINAIRPITPSAPSASFQNIQLAWDSNGVGQNISIKNGSEVLLNESGYIFRSAITKNYFESGVHYWEVSPLELTQNEMKIGVITKRDFDFNTAFCDSNAGFAFYGIGQLRSGNNANGPAYGLKIKNRGVLGVLLDMNEGSITFGSNGRSFGLAFKDSKLQKGPIYPAVALLHCAGCTINYKPIPAYFNK